MRFGQHRFLLLIDADFNGGANFAVYLNRYLNCVFPDHLFIPGRPGSERDGFVMPEQLPEFFSNMRTNAAEHLDKGFGIAFRAGAGFVTGVHKDHHLADGRIKAQGLKIFCDLFNRLMENAVQGAVAFGRNVLLIGEEGPDAVQEAAGAGYAVIAPGLADLQRAHEHFIEAQGIGTVVPHDIAGIHHKFRKPLAHFNPVFAENHALMNQFFEGLLHGRKTLVVQIAVPDPAVHQMADGVLRSADIQIHRQPVLQKLGIGECLIIMGINIPHVIPAGSGGTGHGGGFAGASDAVPVILFPLYGVLQGGLAVLALIVCKLRQEQGQFIIRQGVKTSVLRMHHGNRFAPVALTGENPFPEMIIDGAFGNPHFLQFLRDCFLGFFYGEAGKFFAVDQFAAFSQIIMLFEGMFTDVRAVNDLNHWNLVGNGVFEVTLIMAGNSHNGTGAVGGQYEIADEQLGLFSVNGINTFDPFQAAAAFALVQLRPVHVVLFPGLFDIGFDFLLVFNPGHQILHQLPVRRQNHEGNSVDGFDTGGKDAEFSAAHDLETDFHALALADPVALHVLGAFRPVDLVQAFQQLFSEGRLIDDPLLHVFPHHGIAAALALAVDDLVVAQHGPQLFAPVDGHINILGISVQIKLFKYPLGPFIELGVACGDHLAPVIIKAQLPKLPGEGLNIALGEAFRMVSGGNGILFRRQAEAVIAHGMQHIVSLHPFHAADDIRGSISLRMAGVQSDAAWIWKHVQGIELGFGKIPDVCLEGFVLLPVVLPFFLNQFRIVIPFHGMSPVPSFARESGPNHIIIRISSQKSFCPGIVGFVPAEPRSIAGIGQSPPGILKTLQILRIPFFAAEQQGIAEQFRLRMRRTDQQAARLPLPEAPVHGAEA